MDYRERIVWDFFDERIKGKDAVQQFILVLKGLEELALKYKIESVGQIESGFAVASVSSSETTNLGHTKANIATINTLKTLLFIFFAVCLAEFNLLMQLNSY